METEVYPWDTKEKQQERKPYGFVDFPEDFLDCYRRKRSKAILTLSPDAPLALQLQPYDQVQLELLSVFDAAKVIDTLYLATSKRIDLTPTELKHFWRVLKKADLRKLKASYDGEFINAAPEDLDLQSRALLSLTLLNYSAKRNQGYLQALSTSLKLNDALIAGIDLLRSPLERTTFSHALRTEAREVSRLEKEVLSMDLPNVSAQEIKPSSLHRISNLGMLLQEGNRAKAYLQALVLAGFYPNYVCLLRDSNFNASINQAPTHRRTLLFDPNVPEETTLKEKGIPYQIITSDSCNSPEVVNAIRARDEKYFVFSGKGILNEIFGAGKKLIHVHPGKLPEYRGSTCHFYSVLAGDGWHCSAFIMNPKIDEGDLILTKKFPLPGKNIDDARIYDPYARSKTLVDVIRQLSERGSIQTTRQNLSEGLMYYTIHPVLGFIRRKFLDTIE